MPNFSGPSQVFDRSTSGTAVLIADSLHRIKTRARDVDSNEYILLGGVASTVIGSPVTFDENGSTTLLAANAVGPVAVAMVCRQ